MLLEGIGMTPGVALPDFGYSPSETSSPPPSIDAPSVFLASPRNTDRMEVGDGMAGSPANFAAGETAQEELPIFQELSRSVSTSKTGKVECQTCANRRYQDRSDDASVSFQSPTKINQSVAAATVMAHEREHVTNEKAYAEQEGREILSQSVSLKFSSCPECGKMYVAGGETRTVSKGKSKPENPDLKASEPEAV